MDGKKYNIAMKEEDEFGSTVMFRADETPDDTPPKKEDVIKKDKINWSFFTIGAAFCLIVFGYILFEFTQTPGMFWGP